MSRTTFTRSDCAELWWNGLSDREKRAIMDQAETALNIEPGLPAPSTLELWECFCRGDVALPE